MNRLIYYSFRASVDNTVEENSSGCRQQGQYNFVLTKSSCSQLVVPANAGHLYNGRKTTTTMMVMMIKQNC